MTAPSRTLELLERLIAFPTVSSAGNLDLIDWVETLLRDAGFDVTRLDAPGGHKAGLFARIGPAGEGGVCLSAHTDVVPVEGQIWNRPPFALTQENGRVFGRGTTDMKGFLAAALALAERAQKVDLAAPLSLSISYDEEIGCVGIRQMLPDLERLIGRPRAVIVGEPTSMQVATGHKGKTALRLTCHGQSGHSALAPNYVNAIHVAARVVADLQRLQDRLARGPRDEAYGIPYSTVHVGRLTGGRALNIVPDDAVLYMEVRHLCDTPAEDILADIRGILRRVDADFPNVPGITVEEIAAYPGLATDPGHTVVPWALSIGGAAQTCKVAFGTEAGFFAALGLDTVVIGPGDMEADGHKPDEGLSLSQLSACDAMMDRLLDDLRR